MRVFVALALVGLPAVEGAAADCGDSAGAAGERVPCACGDGLVTSAVLESSDPIVTFACLGDGLAIADGGITLDCGRNAISGATSGEVGVRVDEGAHEVTIKNCRLEGFDVGIAAGPDLEFGPHTLTVMDSRFVGNRVGIEGSISYRAKIVDNVFRLGVRAMRLGFLSGEEDDLGVIKGNRFGGGVQLATISHTAIEGNVFRGAEDDGLLLFESGSQVHISNNRFQDNGAYGIYWYGSLGPNTVTNNVFRRNGKDGFLLNAGFETTIENNRANLNGGHGFNHVSFVGPLIYRGNTANRNGGTGLRVTGLSNSATNSVLEDNTANHNGMDGICTEGQDVVDGGGNDGSQNAEIDVSFNLGPCADLSTPGS